MSSDNETARGHTYRCWDEQTGEPIIEPYKTFEVVEEWSAGRDECCRATVPLYVSNDKQADKPDHPKTLVCHDMAGGYLEDRFVQGVVDRDAYRFYHWSAIDQFIYFSHYFVTIPPPGWTNTAHKHGVPVLGTIITEWDDGKKRCEELLSCPEKYTRFAQILAQMAAYYRFDGWLINIENPIAPEKVPCMVQFVRLLTEEMHRVVPHSIVLWYDSVIHTGELKWQDELNDNNKCFFEVCDGIFLNYTWKDGSLERTLQCVGDCGRFIYDVYVGVDVFGRGCRGGGGFNTKEALEHVRAHYLSVALFAQGWTWEKFEKDHFSAHENRFWALLEPYLTHHPLESLPLCSDFNQGWGHKVYQKGEIAQEKKWGSTGLQSAQPTWQPVEEVDPADRGEDDTLRRCLPYHYHTADGFSGGGSLELVRSGEFVLYEAQIPLPDDLEVTYTSKCSGNCSIELALVTEAHAADDRHTHTTHLLGKDPQCTVEACPNGWLKRRFHLTTLGGQTLTYVKVIASVDTECPLLGEVQIWKNSGTSDTSDMCRELSVSLDDTRVDEQVENLASCSLTGNLKWRDISPTRLDHYVVTYKLGSQSEWQLLGTTTAPLYRMYRLDVDRKYSGVEFRVSAMLRDHRLINVGQRTVPIS